MTTSMPRGERWYLLLIGLVVAFPLAFAGVMVLVNREPDHADLRKGLKEKNGIDAKTIDLAGEPGQLQVGSFTTENGETLPIAVHTGNRKDVIQNKVTVTTQWIVGKRREAAEEEIRKLIEQMGFAPAEVKLQRNPNGIGYIGEVTAKSGEVLDIGEELTGPPLVDHQYADLKPSSYDRWIRNALEKELKEELASLSEFQKQDKSWARQAAERQDRLREEQATERARKKEAADKYLEDIRKSGREPTLAEYGIANIMRGPDPPLVPPVEPRETLQRMSVGRPSGPKAVFVVKTATATTKSGRVVEVETEVQTSPGRSIHLSWRELKK